MLVSRKFSIVTSLIFLIIAFLPLSISSQVFFYPPSVDRLNERWNWAIQEAGKQGFKDGFWIGYSIKRLMDKHSYVYSTNRSTFSYSFSYPSFPKGKSLGETIYGKDIFSPLSDEEQMQDSAMRALVKLDRRDKARRKVWKDVAVLCKFDSIGSKIPVTFRLSNLTMPFNLEGLPLYWLEKAEDEESISFLSDLYKKAASEELKKEIISTIGFHESSEHVVPFLERVLKSNELDKLRGRAALELGDHDSEQAIKILHIAAQRDRSYYVRKRAVYGLEDINLDRATDALIDIARNTDDSSIRKKAISCLAEKASKKAATALEDIVYKDDDTEIQKRAVYALEDFPDGKGLPCLIKIAKTHPKLIIRKKAIYCLGDSDDPRALQALIEILKKE